MVPAEIVYMEKLPLLGTGKIDNMAVTKLVKERVRRGASRPQAGVAPPSAGIAAIAAFAGGRVANASVRPHGGTP